MQECSILPREIPLASWTRRGRVSAGQYLMAAATNPEIISFALGLPAAELFPTAAFAQALEAVHNSDPQGLQYGSPFLPLKAHITKLMRWRGFECSEESVFLTSGSQQGISLTLQLFVEQGGPVICEEHTYFGFQQALQPFNAEILAVPADLKTGLDVDAVEWLLKRGVRPRLIYVIADGHNPLGVSMHPAKRMRLVELAQFYGVPILEDDPYGLLYYRAPLPPLRALGEDCVIYAGSFSKLIAPALRLGWLVAPRHFIHHLANAKAGADVDTATLAQRAVSKYLDLVDFNAHLARLRTEYRLRRDAMLDALNRNFAAARWSVPESGFYIWLELSKDFDAVHALDSALHVEQVAYVPGHDFRVQPADDEACNSMRLSFSSCPPPRIEDGMARLKEVVERFPGRQ